MTVKAIFPRYNMAADMVEILLIIIIKHYSTQLVCYPIGQCTHYSQHLLQPKPLLMLLACVNCITASFRLHMDILVHTNPVNIITDVVIAVQY